jgi:hypothetical protein
VNPSLEVFMEKNWRMLSSLFPVGWQQMAWQAGAIKRLRGFPSSEVLLRMILLHVGRGYSLRETAVQAKVANWADISDVALLNRLRQSGEWLRSLCMELLKENCGLLAKQRAHASIRVVDGTIVKESGRTGSQWRILYSLQLPSLVCDFFDVTATIGDGNGESLRRLPVLPKELILADAGYCSLAGIECVHQRGADVLVRINPQSFVAFSPQGARVLLASRLHGLSRSGQVRQRPVVLHGQGSSLSGRVCAVRKSELAIRLAHRRLHRRSSKKQMRTRPETLEFAKYVLVFTTRSAGSAGEILHLYRTRWQIELAFKRLKSLVQLGHLPKHDGQSSRAWLYGKLFVALLAQKAIRIGRDISPSGCWVRSGQSPSSWREFRFALHQIQNAIAPRLDLQQTISSWNEIARALAEPPRRRLPQCLSLELVA